MSFDPAPVAAALFAARRARQTVVRLPTGVAPNSLSDGAVAQVALATLMGAMPPAGFKIGGTSRQMQAYLGLNHAIAGFMPQTGLHASGAVVAWDDFRGPGTECELAVRLAADLPAGCDAAMAGDAVGDMFAAIEIVENRYGAPPAGDLAALGVPTLIADQVYHAAAVLGAPADWRALDLATTPGRIEVDGTVRGSGEGRDLLGHPLRALAWLAGSAEVAAFGGLRAGQVVMLGSVTPPIWLDGPCTVQVTFAGFAPVTVTFD